MTHNHGTQGTRCTRFGDGLTPKEMRFCEEYVKDFNGAAAVRRANLCPEKPEHAAQYASKYLIKEHVKDYIQQLMNAMSERCTTDVNDLMTFWTTVMMDANESTANRLKASDYIGKAIGAFTVKVETQAPPTIIMDLALPPTTPEPLALESAVDIVMEDDENDTNSE